jgi:hypothetical protein
MLNLAENTVAQQLTVFTHKGDSSRDLKWLRIDQASLAHLLCEARSNRLTLKNEIFDPNRLWKCMDASKQQGPQLTDDEQRQLVAVLASLLDGD